MEEEKRSNTLRKNWDGPIYGYFFHISLASARLVTVLRPYKVRKFLRRSNTVVAVPGGLVCLEESSKEMKVYAHAHEKYMFTCPLLYITNPTKYLMDSNILETKHNRFLFSLALTTLYERPSKSEHMDSESYRPMTRLKQAPGLNKKKAAAKLEFAYGAPKPFISSLVIFSSSQGEK